MRIAVIGSDFLEFRQFEKLLPMATDAIITTGAAGVEACAREFAQARGIAYSEIRPDPEAYGDDASQMALRKVIQRGDRVIALWDESDHRISDALDDAPTKGKWINGYMFFDGEISEEVCTLDMTEKDFGAL